MTTDVDDVDALRRRVAELETALDDAWRDVVAYRFSQVCKHLVAANMLSRLEELGFVVSPDLADAVVNADDERALAHPRLEVADGPGTSPRP